MRRKFVKICLYLLLIVNLTLAHNVLLSTSDLYSNFTQNVSDYFCSAKVKIFMTYYKPFQLPKKGKIIQPIQVGRAIEKEPFIGGGLSEEDVSWLHENMLGDDTGDNISAKNRSFDVLTAYYWVWKHYKEIGNPEYIGFFAHSKILIVTPTQMRKYNRHIADFGIDEKRLVKLLKEHKVITWAWTPYFVRDGKNISTTTYENYKAYHKIEDLEQMINLVRKKYPNMTEAMNKVLYDVKPQPIWNYWIMEKELAFDYFEKLFDIMFELEKDIGSDVQKRDFYQRRAFGLLAERFFAFWLEYQIQIGMASPLIVEQQHL